MIPVTLSATFHIDEGKSPGLSVEGGVVRVEKEHELVFPPLSRDYISVGQNKYSIERAIHSSSEGAVVIQLHTGLYHYGIDPSDIYSHNIDRGEFWPRLWEFVGNGWRISEFDLPPKYHEQWKQYAQQQKDQ